MIIRTYISQPPLSDFAEVFWLYEGFTQPVKERALPTGTVEMVISLRDEVGLTPKLFCRIQRLQEILRRIGNGQQFEWVDVALACGYYDQAHFINDFQDFSGLNPAAYLAPPRDRNPNHVPIID